MPEDVKEGWGVRRPGDRVFHYYADGTSLCRKVGLYQGELAPDDGGAKNPEDCAECYRRLIKRRRSA